MPCSKNIGTNTMQMHSSETNAGPTICAAPSRIAVFTVLPCSRCQLMFSMVTVASSTRMPTANASPPSVMTLRVCPLTANSAMAGKHRQGNRGGDDQGRAPTAKKQQDHCTGKQGGNDAFLGHAAHRLFDDTEASPSSEVFNDGGRVSLMRGSIWRIPSMIDSVEMPAVFQRRHEHGAMAVDPPRCGFAAVNRRARGPLGRW